MSYFGPPIDVLERIADEIGASAKDYPEVREQMTFLATQLERLAPLYEELCEYCKDWDKDNRQVKDICRDVKDEMWGELKDLYR